MTSTGKRQRSAAARHDNAKKEQRNNILAVAREVFGYDTLRPGQEPAIQAVVNGHDTLVVMPTGSGKSAIYQIAATLLPGPTIVVSPLIALQHDQVEALAEHDAGGAAKVNATISAGERRETFEQLARDRLEFLFLAPEQFNSAEVLDHLKAAQPSLVVIDEAHCISEWGHDFRPEYLRLGAVIDALGRPTVLALTATAAPPVRAEIVERLAMRNSRIVVRGFDRPNITLDVERFEDATVKCQVLLERVEEMDGSGIIYAATRRHAEEIATALRERGINAAHYHAGMKSPERESVQADFMAEKVRIIVATTAFGMGIDKANVRFVYHFDISDSVDSYYQEIGRAGRDGKPARALLCYRPEDLRIRRFFAGSGQIDIDEVEQVARAVHQHGEPVDPRELREETELSQTKLMTALSRLEEVGVVRFLPTGEVVKGERAGDLAAAAVEAARAQEHHQEFDQSRIEMMRGYAESQSCRRAYILTYFGEDFDPPCGNCDICLGDAVAGAALVTAVGDDHRPFPVNGRVEHEAWGPGLVMRYDRDNIVVLFDDIGYKTLDLNLVTEQGLLASAES